MTPLTKKQNEFARAYAELGNALQAYATADYCNRTAQAALRSYPNKSIMSAGFERAGTSWQQDPELRAVVGVTLSKSVS
jgi:hypothetical protein